jgi:hypothetical protein
MLINLLKLGKLILAIFLPIASILLDFTPVKTLGQSYYPTSSVANNSKQQVNKNTPPPTDLGGAGGGENTPPPPGQGRPGGGLSGSESCRKTDKPLTALVPLNIQQRLTTSEHPTFWFYIPFTSDEIQSIEFSLHERNEDTIYRTSFVPSKTPGIIGIRLPSVPKYALQQGKYYHWYLIVKCKSDSDSSPGLSVNEWVQRVALPSTSANQINPDIWYNSLTQLAELRRRNPEDKEIQRQWINLLQSAKLENIAEEPIVEIIQLQENQ